jgi:hypothetical protein
MPVQKFKSIEEMNAARLLVPKENDGVERFFRQRARYWRLAPRVYPAGC